MVAKAASGKATVLSYTVNHQSWLPSCPPPYVIAIVALAEDPSVRLTTNIVGCDPNEMRIGMAVAVQFKQQGDIWLPLFIPERSASDTPLTTIAPTPAIRSMASAEKYEDKVAITGIGMSQIGRRLSRRARELTVEACSKAIDDAGLTRSDIDGLCTFPGSSGLPGLSDGGVRATEQILGIHPTWHVGAHEAPGQAGTIIDAMLAVAAGLCRHVLCFTNFSEAGRPAIREWLGNTRITGEPRWSLPFGCASPANWLALYATHYMARYRVEPDFLGWIAVNARRNAALNPASIYKDPLDMDAYVSSRTISTPFRLYDCDVPCDGSIAFVISQKQSARDLRHPPILVESVGTQIAEPQSWDQSTMTHQPNVFGPSKHLWSRTDLRNHNVDVAELYDGFTFNVVCWLEGLGFCAPGEARDFLDSGRRISLTGQLPLNTHGGQLSAGRTNGYGNIYEAVLQLRGDAAERQIADAKVAIVSSGGGITASTMLLRTD
jgi:acetyl-CoA acetyltransferase